MSISVPSSSSEVDLESAVEVETERLYFLSLTGHPDTTDTHHFFCVDDLFHYEPFFFDFGPLNMACVVRFCRILDTVKQEYPNHKLVYYSGHDARIRSNACFLIGAYSVLVLNRTADEAYKPFIGTYPPFLPFRDAAMGVSTFNITVLDCLRGLYKAKVLGWINLDTFNVEEYEHFEQVQHGDWNWVVPGKFVAFSGPHASAQVSEEGFRSFTPEDYIPIFKPRNVCCVIRLNKRQYDRRKFTEYGFSHHDLIYPDGGVPSDTILKQFLEVCEAEKGGIAVHCKAGLGRTGTLIGCYLMKHFKLTANECIAYMRIQRPGMVIAQQQHFMKEVEGRLWKQGDVFHKFHRHVLPFLGAKNDFESSMKLLTSKTKPGHHNRRIAAGPPSKGVQHQHYTVVKAAQNAVGALLAAAPNNISAKQVPIQGNKMVHHSGDTPEASTLARSSPGSGFLSGTPDRSAQPSPHSSNPTPYPNLVPTESPGAPPQQSSGKVVGMVAAAPGSRPPRPTDSLLFADENAIAPPKPGRTFGSSFVAAP
eukprot:TRINITY_DN102933_c0_g1_i1.p1 TRINITY_DN102933_c0_g1~~TRINITY_DN102933_c0_g1_i1.p1  ORF type:complete len:534 (-),score=9.36 TRINITY_DN102933_c0_g1_i1:57-1658(-)